MDPVGGRAVPCAVGGDRERDHQALRARGCLEDAVRHRRNQGPELSGGEAPRAVGESGRQEEVPVLQGLC